MNFLADIIIVNWNGGDKIINCIKSLTNDSRGQSFNIIVSDNGSTDGSLESLKAMGILTIENNLNLGFGAACNRALPYCRSYYVVLLNPDTVVNPGVLTSLIEKLSADPFMASIGPRQVDENGQTQRTCGRFPNFINSIWELTGLSKLLPTVFKPSPIMLDWEHDRSQKVDHVMGSCMVIKKSVIDEIGFMDEGFFVYLEDLDLSKRIYNAGYFNYYDHSNFIYHEGGGLSKNVKAKRLFYALNSKCFYWKKHFTRLSYKILFLMTITVEPIIRLTASLLTLKRNKIKATVNAYSFFFEGLMSSSKNGGKV